MTLLVTGSLPAQVQFKPVDAVTFARLKAQKETRTRLLDPAVKSLTNRSRAADQHFFKVRSVDVDQFGRTVAIYDYHWNGIRIAGASTVAILDKDDKIEGVRHAFKDLLEPPADLRTPKISAKDAEKAARAVLKTMPGAIGQGWQELVLEPQIERVTIPWPSLWAPSAGAGDPTRSVRTLKGWKLVHHIHHTAKGGREAHQTRVDAMTGAILSSNPTHSCAPFNLTANSQYYKQGGSTQVPFQGEVYGNTYALQRGNLFGVHAGDVLNPVYTSSYSIFGDGTEFTWGNLSGPAPTARPKLPTS